MGRTGIIAQKGRTIPLNRISGVDFEIDLTDRIFGCGTLVVTDASEAGRVELHDIPRVEKVQLQVATDSTPTASPQDTVTITELRQASYREREFQSVSTQVVVDPIHKKNKK